MLAEPPGVPEGARPPEPCGVGLARSILHLMPSDEERRPGRAMRLRPFAARATGILSALALLVCGALVLLTTRIRIEAEQTERDALGLRNADALERRLLAFGRASDLAVLHRDAEHDLARTEAESLVLRRLAELRPVSEATHHVAEFEDAGEKTRRYLLVRHDAERRGLPLVEIVAQASGPLDMALAAAHRLAEAHLASLQAAQRRARRWDSLADVFGIAAAIAFLVALSATLLIARRMVHRPLLSLHAALERFADGDREARAAEAGAVELWDAARTFNFMAEQLARQEADRLTFLAGVAHDLRNPLHALAMASETLRLSGERGGDARTKQTAALVTRQVERLDRMVGDLLDASRIEAGQLELRPEEHDARALIEEVAALYRDTSPIHDIRLHLPGEPVRLFCDGTRLTQVLENLVSNAIKYSPHGGRVDLRLDVEADAAVIAVTDQGIGIPAEEIPLLFEPFRRGRTVRSAIPGLGLGLSTSRRIVRAHGGELFVESRPGAGSTFRARLPLDPGAPRRQDARPTNRPAPALH